MTAITAVLSLGFGLNQAFQLIADGRERERNVEELSRVATQQRSVADDEGAYAERWNRFLSAVPASEQLSTFQAVFYGEPDKAFEGWKRSRRADCLTTLLEAAGRPDDALRTWTGLWQNLVAKDSDPGDRARAAIARLSRKR